MTKIPKTLLLDFDGTLVDSMPILEQAYYQFLAKNNAVGPPLGFTELIGSTLLEIMEHVKIKHNLQRQVHDLHEAYLDTLAALYQNSVLPCPGAQSLLAFASSNNIVTAVVTSAPHRLVEVCMQAHQWTKYFNHIVSAEEVSLSKPHPHVYLAALERTGSLPDDAIAIEDSVNGIRSAYAANIAVIAIDAKNDHSEAFRQAGATIVLNNLNQVLDLFIQHNTCAIRA